MKINKYPHGGVHQPVAESTFVPTPDLEAILRAGQAQDYADSLEMLRREEVIDMLGYPPSFSGQVTPTDSPLDYILGLGPQALRKILGKGTSAAVKSIPKIKRQDRFLKDRADHLLRIAQREYDQGSVNVFNSANKLIDDMKYAGRIDDIEYDALLKDIENLFNTSPGGTVSDFPEQFADEVAKKLAKYGLDAESVVKQLVKDADKSFMMNQFGGIIKVMRKRKAGMQVRKR